MEFDQIMRGAREARGMTQEEMGEKIGVSRGSIIAYESGNWKQMSLGTYLKICNLLDLDTNYCFPEGRRKNMCNNDNCESKKSSIEDLKFFLDGYIYEVEEDVVTIPRDEYAELIAEATILRIVETLVESDMSPYTLADVLKYIVAAGNPDEHQSEIKPPVTGSEAPTASDPSKEASE